MRRVQGGSPDVFGALVERHLAAAYAVAMAYTRNRADAEDVAQEVFLKAFRAIASLREPQRFEGWLMAIVRNVALQMGRRRQRESEVLDAAAPGSEARTDDLSRRELQTLLREQLDRLAGDQREILMLPYFAGKNTRAIAESLEISREAAKKRLQRSRDALGAQLLAHLDEAVPPRRILKGKAAPIIAAVLGHEAVPAATPAAIGLAMLLPKASSVAAGLAGMLLAVLAGFSLYWGLGVGAERVLVQEVPAGASLASTAESEAPTPHASIARPAAVESKTEELPTPNHAAVVERDEKSVPLPEHLSFDNAQNSEGLLEKLAGPITIEFESIHLSEILGFMANAYELNIVLDQRSIQPPQQPAPAAMPPAMHAPAFPAYATDGMVSRFDVRGISLRAALGELCSSLGLVAVAEKDWIWISTAQQLAADPPRRQGEGPVSAALQERLESPVTLVFENVHIDEILQFTLEMCEVTNVLDWRVVAPRSRGEGVPPDPGVSHGIVPAVSLRDVSTYDAIVLLARLMNLSVRIEEGFAWLSTPDLLARERFVPPALGGASGRLKRVLYSVHDVAFERIHIADILEFFNDTTDTEILLDRRVTQGRYVRHIEVRGLAMHTLLSILLRQCGLAYVAVDDRILVSTPGGLMTRDFPENCFYPVDYYEPELLPSNDEVSHYTDTKPRIAVENFSADSVQIQRPMPAMVAGPDCGGEPGRHAGAEKPSLRE